jgi:hypothetical protein
MMANFFDLEMSLYQGTHGWKCGCHDDIVLQFANTSFLPVLFLSPLCRITVESSPLSVFRLLFGRMKID